MFPVQIITEQLWVQPTLPGAAGGVWGAPGWFGSPWRGLGSLEGFGIPGGVWDPLDGLGSLRSPALQVLDVQPRTSRQKRRHEMFCECVQNEEGKIKS